MLDGWRPGQTRDIFADMTQLTLGIATRTMFDAESSGDASEVGQALQVLQENFLLRLNSRRNHAKIFEQLIAHLAVYLVCDGVVDGFRSTASCPIVDIRPLTA